MQTSKHRKMLFMLYMIILIYFLHWLRNRDVNWITFTYFLINAYNVCENISKIQYEIYFLLSPIVCTYVHVKIDSIFYMPDFIYYRSNRCKYSNLVAGIKLRCMWYIPMSETCKVCNKYKVHGYIIDTWFYI